MWYYIIAFLIIIVDQWTKWLIVKYMELGESIPIIDQFLYLTSHRNRGAAWGILQGQMMFFYIITVIVIIGVIYYIQTEGRKKPMLGIALGLILGGAIGNFIDRLFRKEVVDFINVYIVNYNYPIFNIADAALVIGVGVILIQTFLEDRNKKREIA